MNYGNSLFVATESTGAVPALNTIVAPSGNSVCQSGEETPVGNVLPEMSDEEREAAAYRAGVAMQSWYSRYQETGDRQALSVAHHHMTQMCAILAGRSAEYIAKLERERGLDGR